MNGVTRPMDFKEQGIAEKKNSQTNNITRKKKISKTISIIILIIIAAIYIVPDVGSYKCILQDFAGISDSTYHNREEFSF